MTGSLQMNAPSPTSFLILIAMSAATLALTVLFHLKSDAVKGLPKDLRENVFSKTFNVFNPFPERRRTFHSYLYFLIFSPLVSFSWTFLLVFIVILKVFQAGLITAVIIFFMCLNLMMTSEAFEIYANASRLVKAVNSGTSLGRGDIVVLDYMRKVLTKLCAYYFVLTCLFTATFFVAPYIFPIFLLGFANFAGAIAASTESTLVLAPILAVFLFSIVATTVFILARKLRTLVFNFPDSGALISDGSPERLVRKLLPRSF